MTLLQLKQLALLQLGEDEQELPEYDALLTTYINEANQSLCQSALHPRRSQTVELVDGGFALSQLSDPVVRIHAVRLPEGAVLAHRTEGERVRVNPAGLQAKAVLVEYEYAPSPLTEAEDVPILPEGVHSALADWATARVLGTGSRTRQGRADFFLMRYYEAKGRIAPQGDTGRITNKYT